MYSGESLHRPTRGGGEGRRGEERGREGRRREERGGKGRRGKTSSVSRGTVRVGWVE